LSFGVYEARISMKLSCAVTAQFKDLCVRSHVAVIRYLMLNVATTGLRRLQTHRLSTVEVGEFVDCIIPVKAREYVFTGVGLCVCVCLSVTTITKKIVDGFAPNFMRMFLGGKGRPSTCFVTIGRGMWK